MLGLVTVTPLPAQSLAPAGAVSMRQAPDDGTLRVEVSLAERRLWVIAGPDTLRAAPVAVASGNNLHYAGRRWRFILAPGTRVVLAKRESPVWAPPDWHYAEVARAHHLRLRHLPPSGVRLRDGRRLVVRDSVVALVTDGEAEALPVEEHVVFDGALFIPPVATRNRQLDGELGRYALDLGDGYLLHGTRDLASIGSATTHGCLRLGDEDLAWLYEHVPVGARVLVR